MLQIILRLLPQVFPAKVTIRMQHWTLDLFIRLVKPDRTTDAVVWKMPITKMLSWLDKTSR